MLDKWAKMCYLASWPVVCQTIKGRPRMVQNEAANGNEIITDLHQQEEILNQASIKLAKLYDLRPHQYRIVLVQRLPKGRDLAIRPGPVVQIMVLWPDLAQALRVRLLSAFSFINRYKLVMPVEIVPYAYMQEARDNRRRWFRKKFGDEAEIFADLLPKTRYRKETKRITEVKLVDRQTGIVVTVSGDRTEYDLESEARIELSRHVRRLEQERESISRTQQPESDSVLARETEFLSTHSRRFGSGETDREVTGRTGPAQFALVLASEFDSIRQFCNRVMHGTES